MRPNIAEQTSVAVVPRVQAVASSFRDPAGFVFRRESRLLRQVNRVNVADYELLMNSGLYADLTGRGLLIPHQEVGLDLAAEASSAARVLEPQKLPYLSFPSEWCFSQLKAAALLTLDVQRAALERGMILKDASAFNVQFLGGRSLFIDTLSFAKYENGQPWAGYRQFCQHFLGPLLLAAKVDIALMGLLWTSLDGIPLAVASHVLPWSTWLQPGSLFHIHLHASAQNKYAKTRSRTPKKSGGLVSKSALLGMNDHLASIISSLRWKPHGTEWAAYYASTNYNTTAFDHKKNLVREFRSLCTPKPAFVWDLGANTGEFSRVLCDDSLVFSLDFDPGAVELNFIDVVKRGEKNILPLRVDLMNPTPNLGWAGAERPGFFDREQGDLILALALIHHLCIANNVPLANLARFTASKARWTIIEFVPKQDSQVQTLLATRPDIFPDYTVEGFESAFSPHFEIVRKVPVGQSERTLYLLRSKVRS